MSQQKFMAFFQDLENHDALFVVKSVTKMIDLNSTAPSCYSLLEVAPVKENLFKLFWHFF